MEIIEDSSVKFTHIAAHTARRQIPPQARHPLHICALTPLPLSLPRGAFGDMPGLPVFAIVMIVIIPVFFVLSFIYRLFG